MGKKTNTDFLAAFIELENACNSLLGCRRSGVTEYINRLKESDSVSGGDAALKKLLKYRKIRNKLAHEEGALSEVNDVDSSDVKWLKSFAKDVERGRDPISASRGFRLSFKKIVGILALALSAAIIAVGIIVLKG